MRCKACWISMTPSATERGRQVCGECGASVLLVDVGLMLSPPGLPPQPSPFREPEPGGIRLAARLCEWEPCGFPIVSENPRARYHTRCLKEVNTAKANAKTTARRAARKAIGTLRGDAVPQTCAWLPCSVEFVPTWVGQLYHAQSCREAKHRDDRLSRLAALAVERVA